MYLPLVQARCSTHLRFFLCSVFAPLCSEYVSGAISCCRSVCEQVRSDCLPVMQSLNIDWPQLFNCSRFHDSDKHQLCMQIPNNTETQHKHLEEEESWTSGNPKKWIENFPNHFRNSGDKLVTFPTQCPPNFVRSRDSLSFTCAPKCGKDAYYRMEDKKFAEAWFTGWAWLCFLSTLFTLLTFCVDSTRFRYPERPIIFLAMCNNFISIAYIVRGSFGSRRLSCTEPTDDRDSYVAVDGLESAPCTFLFLTLYYFNMASSVWFLNLALSWYLSAAKKWSTEALENIASYFHVAAWTLPAVFAVAALVLRKVTADELTGLCQVADTATVPFLVIPHTSLLFAASLVACLGGAALIEVRKAVKMVGRSTSKLERLMSRLIVFGLLYIIPALGCLACSLYESFNKTKWHSISLLAALECQFQSGCPQISSTGSGVEIALLRLFLSLAGGVTTGMWVWSGKTCRIWGSLFTKAPKKPLAGYRAEVVPVILTMPKRTFNSRPMHMSRV